MSSMCDKIVCLGKRQELEDLSFINKVTKGVYELGSVFKTFTLASAFEYEILEPNTIFENLEQKIYCAGNKISEYDEKLPANLTAEQILIRSSNIGSVRIAQKVGIDKYKGGVGRAATATEEKRKEA